jgi:hypothetical protein
MSSVFINDNNLVFLYRYATFLTDEKLLNDSQSPTYTGLNTMSLSGANIAQVAGPGSQAPLSSGCQITGFSTLFHLPFPNQSGNSSGCQTLDASQFSFGGWIRTHKNHTNQRDMISSLAFGTAMRRYLLQTSSGSTGFHYRLRVGTSNGSNTVTVTGCTITADEYQHVICTIDGTTTSDNLRIYCSGQLVASGSTTYDPGSESTSGLHPGVRLFAGWSASSEGIVNSISTSSGSMAGTFYMNRLLTEAEVNNIFQSGFQAPAVTGNSESDTPDTQKDNIGDITPVVPSLHMTAWDATEAADPTGMRHATSGIHPAFKRMLGLGSTSGIRFNDVRQTEVSDPIAITFRLASSDVTISNMKFWAPDLTVFTGLVGFDIAQEIASEWQGGSITLSSGLENVGKTLGTASSVLRSDKFDAISGVVRDTLPDTSGEGEVSQYIYIAFESNNDFTPGDYGFDNFKFRITTDFENV